MNISINFKPKTNFGFLFKQMGKYIPNSEMNTRNSWLEYAVISCFDKEKYLPETEKISLKVR